MGLDSAPSVFPAVVRGTPYAGLRSNAMAYGERWPRSTAEAAARRDGAAQRAADPRADPLGRGGARRATARSRSPPSASRSWRPKLVAKVPGLRGPLKLAEAMAVLPLARRRLPAARLPFEDWRVLAAVGATLALDRAAAPAGRGSALREGARPGDRRGAGAGRAHRPRPRRLPRGRAQGDRRLRAGASTTSPRCRRSTTAAAPT